VDVFAIGAGRVGVAGANRAADRRRAGIGEIVRRVGVSKSTVIAWKRSEAAEGPGDLDDRPNPAGRCRVDPMGLCWRRWSRRSGSG
jgi:hypothetical protein